MDSLIIPVIIGLIAGIALVIIFSTSDIGSTENSNPIFPQSNHVTVVVEGLKDSYHAGEPIRFDVRVEGYGYYCQSPNAAIWNTNQFLKSLPVWGSGLPIVSCDINGPQPVYHYIDDVYDWSAYQDIRIQQVGNYTLGVRLGEPLMAEKQFAVVP